MMMAKASTKTNREYFTLSCYCGIKTTAIHYCDIKITVTHCYGIKAIVIHYCGIKATVFNAA
eukprot:11496934-Ditylum_brightwellii.AAC.1